MRATRTITGDGEIAHGRFATSSVSFARAVGLTWSDRISSAFFFPPRS